MFTTINPGFFTTIQDNGRWGYQAYGMPVAGAMDRYAYRVANLLVGNKAGAAVIEMTILGATFKFDESQLVAICGADMQAKLDGVGVNNWSSFVVRKGSELKFEYAVTGCRAYLAVRGGIDVPSVLGSRSTYTRAKIGGLEGRALRQGDVLNIAQDIEDIENGIQTRVLEAQYIPCYDQNISLRVLLGPQADMFTAEAITTFLNNEYVITDEADRMGYRLVGPKITHVNKADIVSDALPFGAIQVPAHGMPIIMMADRQTTGGYAKIGTVISPDLSKLAQAKPGDLVHFSLCSENEAIDAFKEEQQRYTDIVRSFHDQKNSSGLVRHFSIVVNQQAYKVQVEEYIS
ncbi:biotin-dependent carboxyltransferase family protein [Sporomusa carbonis]|uniref:5-oxoprolinase subunit C family protein n=1 Tax=Sporomusa carbonis TaxID=3076075 RepID=UPI003C7BB863